MKIVFAQLQKDVRCQRGTLILWVLCLVLGGIAYALSTALNHPHGFLGSLDPTENVGKAISAVVILMMCLTAAMFGLFLLSPLLVIQVVHEDPLMGTIAFWQTRPIPRPKLLLAKAIFIGVVVLPLLLGFGNGGKLGEDRFWPAMAGWIAAVAALASITPGPGAWFGYGLAFLFGKQIFSGILNQIWSRYHGPGPLFTDETAHPLVAFGNTLHLTASDIFHLCYLVGFLIVFIHQYLTLRTKKSMVLFIAVLAVVGVLQMLAGPAENSGSMIHIDSSSSSTP